MRRISRQSKPYQSKNRTMVSVYNLALHQYIQSILQEFRSANIPVILFKGFALITDVYDDPSERHLGDVDMLVHSKDLKRTVKLLEKRGFKHVHGNMINARVLGVFDPLEVYIDLHTDLVNPKSPSQRRVYNPRIADLWDRAVLKDFGKSTAFILSPEDRLVYLCFHILKERFSRDKWFRDIELFLKTTSLSIDTRKFLQISRQYGTLKICAMILEYIGGPVFCKTVVSEARKRYKCYDMEYKFFSVMVTRPLRGIFPFREALWILAMDSVKKKTEFLQGLLPYLCRRSSAQKHKKTGNSEKTPRVINV